MNSEILPVIFCPPGKEAPALRIVDYCRRLDGTEVVPFTWDADPPGIRYPNICHQSFLHVLRTCRAKVICWLESDCAPLKADWLAQLEFEYFDRKKPFMLSIDQQTPFDMIGGIGCYDVRAAKAVLPQNLWSEGWDGFLLREHRDKIHRTHLIQHSYSIYDRTGRAVTPHRFPRDSWMIRPTSVIFHKDKYQDLIPTAITQ